MKIHDVDQAPAKGEVKPRKVRAHRVWLVVLAVVGSLCGMSLVLIGYVIFRPQITDFVEGLTSQFTPTATPACDWMTLMIGDTRLRYKNTWMSPDGSNNIPVIFPADAYKIASYEMNYLFALTRKRSNIKIFNVLKGGEQVTVTFEDCNTLSYILSAPHNGTPTNEMLLDQSKKWIIIYLLPGGSSLGMTVRGEQLSTATPVP